MLEVVAVDETVNGADGAEAALIKERLLDDHFQVLTERDLSNPVILATGYRSNRSCVLKGPAPLMWNVRKS